MTVAAPGSPFMSRGPKRMVCCLEGSKGFKLRCQLIGVLLDVPVDFHGSDFVEARRDFTSAGVIRTVKQF